MCVSWTGLGMLPAFSATPPLGPVGLASIQAASTHAAAVTTWVTQIDTWMRTGIAVRNSTPFDTINWT